MALSPVVNPPIFPIVNLNGTSAESLIEDTLRAIRALRLALTKMGEAHPHGRDYQVHGGAMLLASAIQDHESRLKRVQSVIDELTAIAEDVDRQRMERERK